MNERDESDVSAPAAASDAARSDNADRARTVAAELDSLFAEVGDLPPPSREVLDAPLALQATERPAAPRRPLTGTLGALATVILVGAAVGVLAHREQWLQPEAASAARAMSIAVLADPPRPRPAAAPIASEPIGASPPVSAGASPSAPQVAAATPAVPAVSRPVQGAGPQRVASLAPEPGVARPGSIPADPCDAIGPATPARCLAPALDAADDRLGDALDQALEAGVPWPVLNRYRAEWDGLRRRAAREPVAVIESYRAMADELALYAADATDPG